MLRRCLPLFFFVMLSPVFAQRMNLAVAPGEDAFSRVVVSFDDGQKLPGGARSVAGKFGQGVVLGKEGFTVPNARGGQHALDLNHGTLEFWIKVNDGKALIEGRALAANDVGHGARGNFRLWIWRWENAGYLRFDLATFSNLYDAYIIHAFPTDPIWHHVAVTWDRTWGIRLYVDGNAVAEKKGTWEATTTPAKPLVLGPEATDLSFDALRISDVARLGLYERLISYQILPGSVSVEKERSILPVRVKFANNGPMAQKVSCRVDVVDYFQTSLAGETVEGVLKPSETREVALKAPLDEAGPYAKVVINGAEGEKNAAMWFGDEQLVFCDVPVGLRNRISLNGAWDMAIGKPLSLEIPKAGWWPCELPYRWNTWYGDHTRWLRKKVVLPAAMAGKRIELRLSGVRFRAEVILNGQHVGGLDTDQLPCVFDLTSAAKVGQENELLIGVTDWLSCVAPELRASVASIHTSGWTQGREVPGMPFIRPCTMHVGAAGISDPIYVIARPKVGMKNVYATPLVGKSAVKIRAVLDNAGTQAVKAQMRVAVMDGEKVVTRGEAVSHTVAKGEQRADFVFPIDMKGITLWWPGKPKLYRLRVELLENDKLLDRQDVRIGFREFKADGPVFRINGTPIRPNAVAPTPLDSPGLSGYDARSGAGTWWTTKTFMQSFGYINANLCRFHSEPFPELMHDIADEIGLMVVSEAWMATIPFKMKLDDDRTWKNFAEYYPKWVEKDMNYPSVVIRSMENELGYLLPERGAPRGSSTLTDDQVDRVVHDMRKFGRLVKSLDPSRLVMYEGSGPIFYESADIYNVHYPGIPGNGTLYPITGRTMSIPKDSYNVKNWLWDKKKPLYVGEYDCCFADASNFAYLVGDDAYVNGYLLPYHLASWRYSIPGYRIDSVTCGVPWTVFELGWNKSVYNLGEHDPRARLIREMTYPTATFVAQYRETYFEKATVRRTLTTLNDTLEKQAMGVRWQLAESTGKVLATDELTFDLGPAESKVTQVTLTMPEADAAKELTWTIRTVVAGAEVHTTQRTFWVFPNRVTAPSLRSKVAGAGLPKSVAEALKISLVEPANVSAALKDIDVLLIDGRNAANLDRKAVEAFWSRGGRMVVFGVEAWPKTLGFDLKWTESTSPLQIPDDTEPGKRVTLRYPEAALTATFKRCADHPILKDISDPMLKFWREDHLACERTYLAPKDFSSRLITDCGLPTMSPLVEVPCGKGAAVAVSYPVLESFDDQPAARIMLTNIVTYLDGYQGSPLKDAVGVVAAEGSAVVDFLRATGVRVFNLTNQLKKMKSLDAYGVFVVDSSATSIDEVLANREAIQGYVRNGGAVWFHRLDAKGASKLKGLVPGEVTVEPFALSGPIHVNPRGFFTGLSNNDLYWPEGSFIPPASPRVASQTVRVRGGQSIGEASVAAVVADGKGRWLFDEVTWDTELSQRQRALRFVRVLLTNLNVQIHTVAVGNRFTFDRTRGFSPVDIRRVCNEPLVDGIWGTNRGYHGLASKKQVIGEAEYEIIDPAKNGSKGCVVFHSPSHNPSGVKEVTVPVNRKGACLRFLVTSMWTNDVPLGTKILDIDVEYADGTKRAGELRYGRDVLDWCVPDVTVPQNHPRMVWMGKDWPSPGLYDFAWTNPDPHKVMKTIRLRAANNTGYAIVFAISVQEKLTEAQKKVADWVPGLD